MPIINQTLTEREKAAIFYGLFFGLTQSEMYIIAETGNPEETRTRKNLASYATRWAGMPKVKEFIEDIKRRQYKYESELLTKAREEERKSGKGDEERKRTEKEPAIDYTNPENQRKKLNQLVNNAEDSKDALDALKVIIQGQKDDRQAAQERKQTALFLPISCDICPLMEREREKQTRKK